MFGDFLALFAVLAVVSFRLHGTPAQVTFISISYMLPFAILGPVAGVFVDRWNVRRTMVASDLMRAALILMLLVVSSVYQVYAVLIALSAVSTFFMPAQSVTVRTIVPPEGLLAANALMQQAFQVTRIFSPALSGALVATLGPQSCYYLDSATFLFSAAMLSTLVVARAVKPKGSGRGVRAVLSDLFAGIRFIFTHPAISFVIVSFAAGMFAISCFSPLVAIYVRDFLRGGSVLFGVLSSLLGAGMIMGTQLINRFARQRSKNHMVVLGLAWIGGSVTAMGLLPYTWPAAASMFGMGFGVALIIVPAQTIMQQETPHEMVGRVSSSFMSVLSLAQMIGLVFSGSLAQGLGIRNLFYTSGALLFLIAIAGVTRLRRAV